MITKDLVNIGNARITGKVFASKFIGTFNGTVDAAAALTTSAGTATKPVYFSNGKPVATTYALQLMTAAASGTAGTAGLVPPPASGANKKFLRGDATWVSIAGNGYAVCATAAATAAKVAEITGNANWELVTGAMVTVHYSYTNTAQNPTLNVNGTGAKPIKIGANNITTTHLAFAGVASRSINYIYDGGAYQFIGWSYDGDTTYSVASPSANGLMSADDKAKLDAITASADSVAFARSLTSGTKVGTITINGTPTDLYAPTNTDTHYTTKIVVGPSAASSVDAVSTSGNQVYVNLFDDTTKRSSHIIKGAGATTISSDSSGHITISSTDTKYTLDSFGITATAAEINKLDGITATTAEINYLSGVTSKIQTQLDGKAPSSHGTHVTYATAVPLVAGTAAVGTAANVARGDHVHPAQTTITGNAGTATKLATARTIDGVSFDGSADISHFGTCGTGAATAAKTVAVAGFSRVTGAVVHVKFSATNTANNPTLNVNSTGAAYINYRNTNIPASMLVAGRIYTFIYTGNYWEYVGGFLDADATTSTSGLMAAADKTKLDDTNIAYCTCPTAAATAAKVITTSGNTNWKLAVGSMITVNFSYTNTASNPTFNVNGTGAKSVSIGGQTITTTMLTYAGYGGRLATFVYDGSVYRFLTWAYDANTIHTNESLGSGYGTCTTAAATVAKVVTLTNYSLVVNGIVSVKFTYAVPASATLNINSKGAKAIFYKGAAITANIIKAGDTATFIYDGTQYHLIAVDSGGTFTGGVVTSNVQQSGATTDYTTYKFRNIAIGTSTTPTSDATYGVSGSLYIYCP